MKVNDRIPGDVLDLEVRGRGVQPSRSTERVELRKLLREPTLLVFLRHFG